MKKAWQHPRFTDKMASDCYLTYRVQRGTMMLKKGNKVVIAGTRTISVDDAYRIIQDHWNDAVDFFGFVPKYVVTGCARGVDEAARRIAKKLTDRQAMVFEAEWDLHGRAAGPIRNSIMGEVGDALFIIWDGKSRGSAHMKGVMEFGWKKPVFEIEVSW